LDRHTQPAPRTAHALTPSPPQKTKNKNSRALSQRVAVYSRRVVGETDALREEVRSSLQCVERPAAEGKAGGVRS